MKFTIKPAAFAVSAAMTVLPLASGSASAATYAPWLTQMGVTDTVMSAANWGKDQLLAVVDSGIVANHPSFASGQVSTSLSSCAAVAFTCSNGFVDDNAHGTAVAAIAAGNKVFASNSSYGGYVVKANSVISMAPNANIIAEKVLQANGSGYTVDVASGIRKAADAGASVINLSLTFLNSADMIQAANYAASKGVFLVWGGGNSAQALLGGANTTGLSAAAISRLVLVGSVNAGNTISSFSNSPGAGMLMDTSGKSSTYASRWVVTPGEGILAPNIKSGLNAWGYWKGTSMSAPFVSGALALLQSAWPVLRTNGTAANLLLATTKDLGASGVDTTYGHGIINLAAAFRPYGMLTVTKADGSAVSVASLSPSMITSGALGDLPSVVNILANYKSFDTYARDFSVDLSGLIKTPAMPFRLNPLPTNTNTGPTTIKLSNGAEFAYMQAAPANPAESLGVFGLNPDLPRDSRIGYAMLTDKAGTTTAIGYGYPVQFAYAKALYGKDDLAVLSSQSGASSLASLAQGGGLFAYGMRMGEATRLAVSWSGTPAVIDGTSVSWNPAWSNAKASNFALGLSRQVADGVTAGVNLGFLNEGHGLLGSLYDAGSTLSLGDHNRTTSVGVSLGLDVARNSSVLLEAGFATTHDGVATGLLAGTRNIQARSYGMSFLNRDMWADGDRLKLAVVQPLRVASGQVALVVPRVDADGIASFDREWASLVPTGREIDYRLAYDRPLQRAQSVGFQLTARKDVQNVAGNRDASIAVNWQMKF